MILGTFEKQPADVKDYDIDYSQWLSSGDAIQQAVSTVDVIGLTVVSTFTDSTRVKVWLSGGTSGGKYKVTVTVTTTDGRVLQHEFVIKVRDR